MINVHASLLPRHRGAAPVHRAVMAGDTETGVTIMRVVHDLDAGGMLATRRRPIGPDETSPDVERDLAGIGATLLLEVVDQLAEGRATETPQDEALVTFAPKILKSEGVADWARPAREIHDRVRGLQPWPLVSVRIGPSRYLLHRTEVVDERTAAAPGSVVSASGDQLTIAAGDGRLLRVLQIQPEGRRTMSARDLLAGHPIPSGTRLDAP
jgi:methionyl-tRNA formyltransferase